MAVPDHAADKRPVIKWRIGSEGKDRLTGTGSRCKLRLLSIPAVLFCKVDHRFHILTFCIVEIA